MGEPAVGRQEWERQFHGEPATGVARFEVAEAERLPFGDESLDPAFGNSVLHHLEPATAVAEMVRVVRPSGAAVFAEPSTIVLQGPLAADHPRRA
jgi:ubiquinone/menaquinone biosynthesis C-methylase UbiE